MADERYQEFGRHTSQASPLTEEVFREAFAQEAAEVQRWRELALAHAVAVSGGTGNSKVVLRTAAKFFAFLKGDQIDIEE